LCTATTLSSWINGDFVSECAQRHDHVVEELIEQGTVVPMKLFTLFVDDAAALAALGEQRAGLEAAFTRVAGCREFGLRVRLRARSAHPALLEDDALAARVRAGALLSCSRSSAAAP
jgi:hypothetical protein